MQNICNYINRSRRRNGDMMLGTVKLLASRCLSAPVRFTALQQALISSHSWGWVPKKRWIIPTDIIQSHGTTIQQNDAPYVKIIRFMRHRHLEATNVDNISKLLQVTKRPVSYLNVISRTFMFQQKNEKPKKNKKRVPKLVLIQSPFTWLMTKIDFSVLRNVWDPAFHETEFKFGTKQAISRVTQVISDGQYSELNGLLTKAARLSLMRELDRNWSERQRALLALNRDDIQISSPRKVYFIRIADKKFCDVDMAFLALKWVAINNNDALIFAEIFARFHRDYTPHCIPEWTIAYFKVTRFEVLRR